MSDMKQFWEDFHKKTQKIGKVSIDEPSGASDEKTAVEVLLTRISATMNDSTLSASDKASYQQYTVAAVETYFSSSAGDKKVENLTADMRDKMKDILKDCESFRCVAALEKDLVKYTNQKIDYDKVQKYFDSLTGEITDKTEQVKFKELNNEERVLAYKVRAIRNKARKIGKEKNLSAEEVREMAQRGTKEFLHQHRFTNTGRWENRSIDIRQSNEELAKDVLRAEESKAPEKAPKKGLLGKIKGWFSKETEKKKPEVSNKELIDNLARQTSDENQQSQCVKFANLIAQMKMPAEDIKYALKNSGIAKEFVPSLKKMIQLSEKFSSLKSELGGDGFAPLEAKDIPLELKRDLNAANTKFQARRAMEKVDQGEKLGSERKIARSNYHKKSKRSHTVEFVSMIKNGYGRRSA